MSRLVRGTRRLVLSLAASWLVWPDTCRQMERPGRGQLGGLHMKPGQAPVQPRGQPPVRPPEHVHHGRNQDRAGDVGIDEDGGGETEAYLLDGHP